MIWKFKLIIQCLVQLGIAKKEHLFYDNIIYNRHLEDSFL